MEENSRENGQKCKDPEVEACMFKEPQDNTEAGLCTMGMGRRQMQNHEIS